VPTIGFLRRLRGSPRSDPGPVEPAADSVVPTDTAEAAPGATSEPVGATPDVTAAEVARPAPVACPSCGWLLDPAPTRSRPCPACRQPIVVRQFEGRLVYLSESALAVYEAERAREAQERAWDAERGRWLQLAAGVGVPTAARDRVGAGTATARAVETARRLYMDAADRTARAARQEGNWTMVAHLRREQAAAWFAALGNPVPPPEPVADLHRDGMLAVLRSLASRGTDAELVGAGCCPACRKDDGKAFKIAGELQHPRLPHPGCPKGLCACDWWIGVVEKKRRRRRRAAGGNPGI